MPNPNTTTGAVRDFAADESASRFALIIEATTDVVAMADKTGRLLYVNTASRKLLGLDPESDISGFSLSNLHPEWALKILLHEGIPVAQLSGSWSGETALVSSEGREYPVLQLVLAHFSADGQVDFISTICRDISDRKLKELERIEWANRYNAAVRASGQVVFDWDTLSGWIAYGGEIEQLLGFSPDEMGGGMERLRAVIHPDDESAFTQRLEMVTSTRDTFDHSFRMIRKDGAEIVAHAQGCFFLDRHGQIARMVGFLRDVTQERVAERAIQLANEQLEQRVTERTRELAEANLDLQNSALRQAAVSRLGQRALAGQSLSELMLDAAKIVVEILPCDCTSVLQYDENADLFKPLAESGWQKDADARFPIPGGKGSLSGYAVLTGETIVSYDLEKETRFEYSRASRVSGMRSGIAVCIKTGDRPLGVFASFSRTPREFSRDDVSFIQSIANVLTAAIDRHEADESIRRARAEAESANRAKSEFLSRMSHELRTPLNAILGFTQLLEMEEHTAKQNESIIHISRAGRNLLELINEVLDIARLDSGRMQFNIEPVDVLDLLREAASFATLAASRRKITLRIIEPPGLAPFVSCDHERLRQVLLNLLSNATKFNRDGGSITLSVAPGDQGTWRISVTDTGHGIAEDKLARLFVPFERLGTREGGTEGGTGLGLALCQRVISSLGGRIGVTSTIGGGSTFWVELPASEPAVESAPTPSLKTPDAAVAPQPGTTPDRRKILYIEDDKANYYLLERFLSSRKDIHLFPALQGSTGIEIAQRERPALILLDLNLPDMNGEQVLRALRADPATAEIPVVAVTGEAVLDYQKELKALGVTETLVKPYKLAQITDLLERTFGASAGAAAK
jgi:PAS domain S-box-containing protein